MMVLQKQQRLSQTKYLGVENSKQPLVLPQNGQRT